MRIRRYLLGQGLLFFFSICELYLESPGGLCYGYVKLRLLLWLLRQPGERLHYVSLWLCYGFLVVVSGYVMLWLLLRLRRQPGGN